MSRIAVILLILCLFPWAAVSEVESVYTLVDEEGHELTDINHQPSAGDEYIASDNQHYRVTQVDEKSKKAVMELVGAYAMPDVSWLDEAAALQVSAALGDKKIAMYCTHSDESYVPTDGTESDEQRGGIYDVAGELADQLQSKGVKVTLDTTTHNPHDAGAYRRSRQTAVKLLKAAPDAIFDVHRDGIPDPDQYTLTMGGEKMSKVRLLVGKGNQNASANKAFATQLKAVADKVYPGLIKDIYMGKGAYNQDLYPRSVLLEMGTHTVSKERVINAADPLADVIYRTLYGGVTGAAGASDAAGTAPSQTAEESNAGAGTGIGWVLGVLAVGGGIFALLSTGSFKGAGEKMKRTASEVTGGLLGKRPKK
ncbi:MAG: stage II sporulation protein P [Clostridia bacterium]|nr:stage II sporulation protein P [Clostridia bacterium]